MKNKERIKNLMDRIKNNEYFNKDNFISIINCFIKQNFRPLSINEIVSIICDINKLENDSQKYNVRNKVMGSLTNNIFRKKKYKYDLDLEKTVIYLTSLLDSRPPFNSNDSISNSKKSDTTLEKNYIKVSPVFNFPDCQNETIYFPSDENQQKSSCSNVDDNSFTFGEQSQIKINKKDEEETLIKLNEDEIKKLNKNNIYDEEFKKLENKASEKFIPKWELIFDRNNYFVNLEQYIKEFFKSHEKSNENNADFLKIENDINDLYSLIKEFGLKSNSFTKHSSLFNEQKGELNSMKDVIYNQFKLIRIILKANFIQEELISNEKRILKSYVETFKNIFMHLQENYDKSKLLEKEINEVLLKIKNNLKMIREHFPNKKIEKYKEFEKFVENIENGESIPIKVNINETVKLFYYYINKFEDYFLEIESNN